MAEQMRMRTYKQTIEAGASMDIQGPYGITAIIAGGVTFCGLFALYGSGCSKIFPENNKVSVVPSSNWGWFTVTNNGSASSAFVITVISHS